MASFWAELNRRNVSRVAVAYVIVAWLLIQVAATVFPVLDLPEWTARLVTILLIMGFPVVLIVAWAFEVTPTGIKRTDAVVPSESIARATGQKLNHIIIAVLALAVVFLVIDNYVLDEPIQQPEVVEADPEVLPEPEVELLPNSVAVLPFENMSPDPDNAYFAAGIHEELLTQLAKVSALNVIARTTMLRYGDTNRAIPEIARELRVRAVMEGSVQYAGQRVRVTAQLIDPDTMTHVWSERYDNDLSDIFATQTDIAKQVAAALKAELLPAELARIEKVPTDSPEAYAFYLKAHQAALSRDYASRLSFLDQAIAEDPEFALAFATRARARAGFAPALIQNLGESLEEIEKLVYGDAERALLLDPDLVGPHLARAAMHRLTWRWEELRQDLERAVKAGPNDPYALSAYGGSALAFENPADALAAGRRAIELDPGNFFYHNGLAYGLFQTKDLDGAVAAIRQAINLNPTSPEPLRLLAAMEAARGNSAEVNEALRLAEQLAEGQELNVWDLSRMAYAYGRAGFSDDAMRYFRRFQGQASPDSTWAANWSRAYLAIGEEVQALEWLTKGAADVEARRPSPGVMNLAINAYFDPVLDQPEFVEVRNRILATIPSE